MSDPSFKFKDSRKIKHPESPLKRNRRERQSAEVYRLENLFVDEERKRLGLDEGNYIEGNLAGYVVVSVPETTTYAMAEEIKQKAMVMLKQPVTVITHNIAFLKATKLTPKEAAKIIKDGEDYAEQLQKEDAHRRDGDRSGPSVDGDGDSGKEGDRIDPEDPGDGGDQESDEEGIAKHEGQR